MHIRYHRRGLANQNKVALTFDDGPNPPRTDQVLQILAEKDARATFFVVGKWAERWPQALQRMSSSGNTIGNHSHLHLRHLGDFDRAEAAITAITGQPSRFLRIHFLNNYPAALYSPLAQSSDIRIIDADINPADYSQTDPDEIVRRVLETPGLSGGSIIDLHDGSESEDDAARLLRPLAMIRALPRIIDGLQERGFQLVGLDDLELGEPEVWSAGSRDS